MSENTNYTETAQACVEEIRTLREKIPNLALPKTTTEGRRLAAAASVPPDFIELTLVAVKNSVWLVRNGATDAEVVRNFLKYADAFGPVADELETLAYFVRHSVTLARHTAGAEALATYAITKRLAKLPQTVELVPVAAAMAEKLGKRKRKAKPVEQTAEPPQTPESKE